MVSRRRFLTTTGIVGSAAVLAGCGIDSGGSTSSEGNGSEGGDNAPFVIYTARDKNLAESVVKQFEEAKPEWAGKVTILTLGAQEGLERVRAEKSNPQGDVLWGGTRQQMQQGASDGVFAAAPQKVIDAVPENFRDADGLWVGEMQLAELFMINTDMMSADEAPADWDDLIKSDMKDKLIIRDVEPSGTMRSIYSAMIDRLYDKEDSPEPGYDWLLDLDKNTKTYAANPTDMYQRVSRQEAPMSLWNLQDIMLQKYGDFPMFEAVVPKSGAPILIDGVAKIANGPSSAGADAFLEFLFSEDAQGKLSEERYQIPTIKLSKEPSWLGALGLHEMELNWDRIGADGDEWISYWASNIKGKG